LQALQQAAITTRGQHAFAVFQWQFGVALGQ